MHRSCDSLTTDVFSTRRTVCTTALPSSRLTSRANLNMSERLLRGVIIPGSSRSIQQATSFTPVISAAITLRRSGSIADPGCLSLSGSMCLREVHRASSFCLLEGETQRPITRSGQHSGDVTAWTLSPERKLRRRGLEELITMFGDCHCSAAFSGTVALTRN
ncbi:MAG: hypothetical protein JWQ42_5094 [Edaphobacter sp.]|nr:hypothetical protein [Edaphobacter sp.]